MSIVLPSTPEVLQLTPGPTGIHPDVQEAVARQTKNHTNPDFLQECRWVKGMIATLMGTVSDHTGAFTCSGTGGNEAAVMNFVHPGDRAVFVDSGFFGDRVGEIIRRRSPQETIRISMGFGETIDPNRFEDALLGRKGGSAFLAQIETATGTQVPDEDLVAIGQICARHEVMLCIDAVCAFGGTEVAADRWNAAFVSACSQKGVNAPAGTAPFTVAPFAMDRIRERTLLGHPPGSFYLDLDLNSRFWNEGTYHATPAVQNIYGLGKALEMTMERARGDLPGMFRQHTLNQRALEAGFGELGFVNPVELKKRAAVVSVFETPQGVDAQKLRQQLLRLKEVRGRSISGVEVAAGKRNPEREIRVALLGFWSTMQTVLEACDAMEQVTGMPGKATTAAERHYAERQTTTA